MISSGNHTQYAVLLFSRMEYRCSHLQTVNCKGHKHQYTHDFRLHNKVQCFFWNQGIQVLATSLSGMCKVAVRVYPFGVFLFALYLVPMPLKKRLKIMSPTFLPEAFSYASHAIDTLWRPSSIALRTASTSEQSIISSPLIPFVYRKPLPFDSF